jgi:hypothetical protein
LRLQHRYSRSSGTVLEPDLQACRADDPIRQLLANLKQGTGLWASADNFTGSLADRSGLPAMFIACKHLGSRDLLTGRTNQFRSKIDRHHILPRALFQVGPERQSADSLANIAFIVSDSNKSIGDGNPERYLASIDTAVLAGIIKVMQLSMLPRVRLWQLLKFSCGLDRPGRFPNTFV